MKVEINIKKEPFEVTITEEIEDTNPFDFIKKFLEFIEENKKFLEIPSDIKSSLSIFPEEKSEVDSEISPELFKLAKESRLNETQLLNLFDVDDLEYKVFPLLKPVTKGKYKTDNQKMAVIIFLYENSVINNDNTLSSKALTELFMKSRMDSSKLSDAFRQDQSLVKIESRSYRITKKGILEAPKILTELLD